MNDPNKYGLLADTCLQWAITAKSVDLADEWLRIAARWLAMEQFRHRMAARNIPNLNLIEIRDR